MLSRVKLNRKDCYITNVLKHRPPQNKFSIYYEGTGKNKKPTQELLQARSDLRSELSLIKPKVIVCLGSEALKALTEYSSIEKWRGSPIESPLGLIIPTYHPAYILRVYSWRAVTELDLRKALRFTKEPYIKPKYDFIISPSFQQVVDFLTAPPKTMSFDIETIGQHTRCLGFAWSPTNAFCIPFIKNRTEHYWSLEEEREILRLLYEYFKNPLLLKIAQNYPFDTMVMAEDFGFIFAGLWMDTMIAAHTCYSEMPKGLDFLASIYTDIPYWSDYSATSDEETFIYNCFDNVSTFQIAFALKRELESLKLTDFYHNHCQPVMLALAKAGHRGVLIDLDKRNELCKKCNAEKIDIEKKIESIAGQPVNPNSPKQVKDFLYTTLRLRPITHRKTHAVTTNEEALMMIRARDQMYAPIIDLFLHYRELTKLIGTFLTSETKSNGRLPTSYNATGTVNGRISSSKTIFGLGGNLQQVPRGEFRRLFISPPGYTFVKIDLSQAEARAVAWIARITGLIFKFCQPGFDVHKWNASLIWSKAEEDITPAERQMSKSVVHGANYLVGPRTASILSGVSYSTAKIALERYKKAMPELTIWHENVKTEVSRTRMLRTKLGRLRVFMDRLDDSTFKSAVAFEPQSLVGDIINLAFARLTVSLQGIGFPCLQVHDEIVSEVKDEHLLEACKIIKRDCEIPINFSGISLPLIIPLDMKVGKNWFDMKGVKL